MKVHNYLRISAQSRLMIAIFCSLIGLTSNAISQTLPIPTLRIDFAYTYGIAGLSWTFEGDATTISTLVLETTHSTEEGIVILDTLSLTTTYYTVYYDILDEYPKCGTQYFRLIVSNNKGESRYSEIIQRSISAPSVPREFLYYPVLSDPTSNAIKWYVNNEPPYYFKLERAEQEEGPYTQIANVLNESRLDYVYTDRTIVPGRDYYYRISSFIGQCQSDYLYLFVGGRIPITDFPLKLALKRLLKMSYLISWKSLSVPHSHWIIERSVDEGKNFKEIGKVVGKQLSFEDLKPLEKGIIYYRVTAMDGDKVVAISKKISTEEAVVDIESEELVIYPNPFKDTFTIKSVAAFGLKLKLLSEKGKEVAIDWREIEKGLIQVELKQEISEGSYFLHLYYDNTDQIEKIRVAKVK